MTNKEENLKFLSQSLKMHQRPFIITSTSGEVLWLNNASKYIFSLKDDDKPNLLFIDEKDLEKAQFDSEIADSFDVFMKINLRKKDFVMRVLLHVIPVDDQKYFLIEIVSNSKENLFALKTVLSCLEHDRIGMNYQKQYRLTGNKELTGIEALIRFYDENNKVIPNDKVIPFIEGENVFSLVVISSMDIVKEYFDARKEKGLEDVTLFFNVSAHTILHKDFLAIFKDFIQRLDIKPGDFGIEVTETAELNNLSTASLRLSSIKNLGVSIALDDFGAGYSALRYLKDLPVDVLKLDKSFTFELDETHNQSLVQIAKLMADSLSMEFICEGLEEEWQVKRAISLGCEMGQGFYLHKPCSLEDLNNELQKRENITYSNKTRLHYTCRCYFRLHKSNYRL